MAKGVRTAMAHLIRAWEAIGQPLLGEAVHSGSSDNKNETKQTLVRLMGTFVKHSVLKQIGI